jgi:hypothetical protein
MEICTGRAAIVGGYNKILVGSMEVEGDVAALLGTA